MDLRRQRGGGSHASTTSVPLRGAVTMVSDAPMRSARSCMLVMPNPPTMRSLAMPRPSSATDSRRPIDLHRRRANRDAPGARVAHRVGQRFLRDADHLALDAVAEARQLVERRPRSARRSCVCARSARRLSAVAMSSPSPTFGRSAPTDRRASTMCVRARSTAVSMLARDCRRQRRALPLRGLQLHQDRGEPLREVVVNVAGEPIALLEDRLAALLEPASARQAALVQRQRRLPRNRLDQRDAPPAVALEASATSRASSSRDCVPPRTSGVTTGDSAPCSRLNVAHGFRQPRIVACVLDGLAPARLVVEDGSPCSRAAS